jgi:hypothetical protein
LFLPLALAHRVNFGEWLVTALGFFLFGMCASGLYILNDLLDLHSDRGHPWKHKRGREHSDSARLGDLASFSRMFANRRVPDEPQIRNRTVRLRGAYALVFALDQKDCSARRVCSVQLLFRFLIGSWFFLCSFF